MDTTIAAGNDNPMARYCRRTAPCLIGALGDAAAIKQKQLQTSAAAYPMSRKMRQAMYSQTTAFRRLLCYGGSGGGSGSGSGGQ